MPDLSSDRPDEKRRQDSAEDIESTDFGLIDAWIDEENAPSTQSRAQRRWQRRKNIDANVQQALNGIPEDMEALGALAKALPEEGQNEEIIVEDEEEQPATAAPEAAEEMRIAVEVAEDGMEAAITLLDLTKTTPRPDLASVLEFLSVEYGVIAGIDAKKLGELIERARREVVEGPILIARGRPACPGEDGRIVFPFATDSGEESQPIGPELRQAMREETPRAVLRHNLQTCLVAPGQTLAEVLPPGEGTAGHDVFGQPLRQPGQPAERPGAGDNVTEEENRYLAAIYGYVCLIDNALHILSPLWISPDGMKALFIHFSQICKEPLPESDWIMQLLEKSDVRHGIQETAMEKLCAGTAKKTRRALLLARGEPVQNGADAYFKPAFDFTSRPGKMRQDGSIDFRDRNIIVGVTADQHLGEFVPAAKGTDGMNLRGEVLAAQDGRESEFSADEGVRAEEDEAGITRYYAEREGSVRCKNGKLSVLPVVAVDGDVDYAVGHIETRADVQIQGSVLSGFHVRSLGNVVIGGRVENGARIWAEGDVAVSQSIVGQDTRVIAGGSVECKFIQNSQVVAQGSIKAGSYILNSRVHAGEGIAVSAAGGKRAGSIIGGEVFAGTQIECAHLGSSGLEHTLVGCRPTPATQARLHKQQLELTARKKEIGACLAILGVSQLDTQQINAALASVPPDQRATMIEAFKKAYEIAQSLPALEEEIAGIEAEGNSILAAGRVKATQNVYPEVVVEFGARALHNTDARKAHQFFLSEETLVAEPL